MVEIYRFVGCVCIELAFIYAWVGQMKITLIATRECANAGSTSCVLVYVNPERYFTRSLYATCIHGVMAIHC